MASPTGSRRLLASRIRQVRHPRVQLPTSGKNRAPASRTRNPGPLTSTAPIPVVGNRSNKKEWVKPSAFIVGTARIDKALKEVTIKLESFGPDGEPKALYKPFTVPVTRRTLVEAGYSYVLTKAAAPALFDGARGGKAKTEGIAQFKQEDEEASIKDLVVRNDPARPEPEKAPALSSLGDSPVKLKIFYNGEEVPVADGQTRDPKENDKVTFVLETRPDRRPCTRSC